MKLLTTTIVLGLGLTTSVAARAPAADPLVGTWLVEQPAAPFPLHLYVFNADHTMSQSNPDAGNPRTSDSDGKGVWSRHGSKVTGKWVEIMADRTTHKLLGRGELSFELTVSGDRLVGTGTFYGYDTQGKVFAGPIQAPFTGTRVVAP
jgi:hypothetical protein